jgi:hypothetical protein
MQALAASLAPLRHASGSGLMPSGSLPESLGGVGSDGGTDAAVPDAQEAHYLGELRKFIKDKGARQMVHSPHSSGRTLSIFAPHLSWLYAVASMRKGLVQHRRCWLRFRAGIVVPRQRARGAPNVCEMALLTRSIGRFLSGIKTLLSCSAMLSFAPCRR